MNEDLRKETPPERELSLLSENQRLREDNHKLAEDVSSAALVVVMLEEEAKRLRKALRQIAEYDSDDAIFYVDIARAALDGEEAAKDEGKYGDWRDTSVDYGL